MVGGKGDQHVGKTTGKTLTLVLGGVRAGKSSYAKNAAIQRGGRTVFVATAEAGDAEMAARIAAHQRDRPPEWHTIEEPLNLATALDASSLGEPYDTVVLDCLTLWVSNLLLRDTDRGGAGDGAGDSEVTSTGAASIAGEVEALLDVYERGSASWVVVSNEVGLGVVPPTALGRLYADELGRANQMVAARADTVVLLTAGIPMVLKGAAS